jgi:hypothetical protein
MIIHSNEYIHPNLRLQNVRIHKEETLNQIYLAPVRFFLKGIICKVTMNIL